jgi:hypothetical protein
MSPSRFFYSCISLLLIIFLSTSQITGQGQEEKHIEVALRMIGHQLLLEIGDSTSRVLPIVHENDQYSVRFESEFELNPDQLVSIVNKVMEESKFPKGYFVEVEQCETGEIVYSYEIVPVDDNAMIPCRGRDLPKSCYSLLFTLKDPEKESMAAAGISSESDDDQSSRRLSSLFLVLPVLIGGIFLFLWNRKKIVSSNPDVYPLGKFRFDKRHSELIMDEQRIELSSKEADLLYLLHNGVNTTIEREVILNIVWKDEGDYVGRTLDVFISKLRKKLEADPAIKIVNIRGIGYKLVVDA